MELQTESSGKSASLPSETGNVPTFRLECDTRSSRPRLWTLRFDMPGEKVNKLDLRMMSDCERMLGELEGLARENRIDALVLLSGKPDNFIAGADIKLIQAVKTSEEAAALSAAGQALLNRWEELPFPTVAAVQGAALGGGCEFALACTAIVLSDSSSTRIGLPEVMLGLLPGMGGCLRLPQRIGLVQALDLILMGKQLKPRRALELGLADAVLPARTFEESALAWTAKHLAKMRVAVHGRRASVTEPLKPALTERFTLLVEKAGVGRSLLLDQARSKVLAKTRGHYPALLEVLGVIERSAARHGTRLVGSPRDHALALEAAAFGRLAVTDVARNLIRIFFSIEEAKGRYQQPGSGTIPAVRSVGVVGAGVMGAGIARLFAKSDVVTKLQDQQPETLARAVRESAPLLGEKMARLAPAESGEDLRAVDLVVEAIVEKMDVKKSLLAELESAVRSDCVLATNTSSLSVTEMQKGMRRPHRLAGMHFFNPVHKMPLVEIIQGYETSEETIALLFAACKRLGKTPIVVRDCPGFLVNRVLAPYLNEALHLLMQGVPIGELDDALLDFGMPMGPLELIDEVGVDVADHVGRILLAAYGDRLAPPSRDNRLLAAGRLGKKSGKGLYDYVGGKKREPKDGDVYELLGVTPRPKSVPAGEIVERCVLPMINEASRCLDEGAVGSAADVDLGMLMGTGFAPFRGGLLRYADSLGAKEIVSALKRYEQRFGARFEAALPLTVMALRGGSFHR